jgi:hypothetical protein
MMARLFTLVLGVALFMSQANSFAGDEDRGYEEGDLRSEGAGSNALSDAGGVDISSAAARGRDSAASVAADRSGASSGRKPEIFKSPEAATKAFVEALRRGDRARLEAIFVDPHLISSGDDVGDRIERERFLKDFDRQHSFGGREQGMTTLYVGQTSWPFAVPIVKGKVEGKEGYYFDSVAGARDVLFRRVGRNERRAIAVCSGFVAAQKEYALVGHDGQPAGVYAQKLMSDSGKRNGLFWPVKDGELRSPAGQALAAAEAEGYGVTTAGKSSPYRGYLYRTLPAQSEHARAGARNYMDSNGRQSGGFALLAYPAEYGRSGVKSFIVNQDGIVYEKDLGPQTTTIARAVREFDPQGWRVAL